MSEDALRKTTDLFDWAAKRHKVLIDLGYKEVPTTSTWNSGWWEEPLCESKLIPAAVKRQAEILKAGIPVTAWYVRHESTNLLGSPVRTRQGLWVAVGVVVAAIALGLLVHWAVTAIGVAIAAAMAPVVVDPQLVAVLPDGRSVVCYRWSE